MAVLGAVETSAVTLRDAKHQRPVINGPRCRNHGPRRALSTIRVIVIHDAEAPSNGATGVANYGATTGTAVSWHVVVDDNKAFRQLPDGIVSWTAPGCNYDGLHIEQCGYARYSKLDWFRHQATLKRAAWIVAKWCRLYKIPPVWLTDEGLRAGKRGLVTHAQVSRVYKRSDHTDPGPNYPRGYFALLVRRRIGWLE